MVYSPAFGGKSCVGSNEEFKTCEQPNCIVDLDLRQQQCQRLPSRAGFNETSEEFHMTWLPHENDEDRLKCRLSCRSAESGKIYLSEESVQDGTLCKYGSMDICVQVCYKIFSIVGESRQPSAIFQLPFFLGK